MFRQAGSVRHVHDGWSERQYHGVIRFVASVGGERFAYQAKFTDGRLVAVREYDDEDGEWIPSKTSDPDIRSVDDRRRAAGIERGVDNGPTTETVDSQSYKLTARQPLADAARIYDVSISEDALADASPDERYLQLLHLPDDRGRVDASTDVTIPRGCVYELAIRQPRTIEERDGSPQPISRIVERDGPFELETALRRLADLASTANHPIHSEMISLRPTWWSGSNWWVTCPACRGDEIMLVTNLDESELTLACRTCNERVTSGEHDRLFQDWLHCPACDSGDVNVEVSAPHGRVWWSCDDCGYDTLPGPTDPAYTDVRDGESPGH